jgi:hypothetical protein
MEEKYIDIKIGPDGTISVDLVGYKGVGCEEDLRKITKVLGTPVSSAKKSEYYEAQNEECIHEGH